MDLTHLRAGYTTIVRQAGRGLLAACLFATAWAATTYQGVAIYVTGPSSAGLDNWNPGGTPGLQLLDDGVGNDLAADDGIFTCTYTPTAGTGAADMWKVAPAGWAWSVPEGNTNSFFRPLAGVPVTFLFDTTVHNDGYTPDVGGALPALVYTRPAPVLTTDTVAVVGDFLAALGGTNWNASDTHGAMNDLGTGGDATAGDGIYTLRFSGIPAANYSYKVLMNANYNSSVSSLGYRYAAGGNLTFPVLATTDTLTFLFDTSKGRVRVNNSNPLLQPGPPFYAASPAWGEQITSDTLLFDDGTHGDVTANDGIHSREFLVATPNGTQTLRVLQGVGPSYPNSGPYPYRTTYADQPVLVQFDTNTRADGFIPVSHYVWVNPVARQTLSRYQVVGNFMWNISGNLVGDWAVSDDFTLVDEGTLGDATAGDAIYTRTFSNTTAYPGSSVKAIVGPTGNEFSLQMGGPGEGFTVGVDNISATLDLPQNASLRLDAVTGRVGVTGMPTRPASLNAGPPAPTAIRNWTMY